MNNENFILVNNNTNDELLNIIFLLKETLNFYANENNYKNNYIISDNGFQAQHTLKNVNTLINNKKIFQENLQKIIEIENIDINNNKLNNFLNKLNEI